MCLVPSTLVHLVSIELCQTSHSCCAVQTFVQRRVVCGVRLLKETKVEQEVCQTLEVIVRRSSTKQLQEQTLPARVKKSGVLHQRGDSDFQTAEPTMVRRKEYALL